MVKIIKNMSYSFEKSQLNWFSKKYFNSILIIQKHLIVVNMYT